MLEWCRIGPMIGSATMILRLPKMFRKTTVSMTCGIIVQLVSTTKPSERNCYTGKKAGYLSSDDLTRKRGVTQTGFWNPTRRLIILCDRFKSFQILNWGSILNYSLTHYTTIVYSASLDRTGKRLTVEIITYFTIPSFEIAPKERGSI